MIPAMGSSGLCHQSLRWEHAGWDRGGHLLLLRANSGQHLGLFCFAMILASLSGILRSPNCSRTLTLSTVAYQKAVCGEGLREAHSPHPYLPASAPGGLTALPQSLQLCPMLVSLLYSWPLAFTFSRTLNSHHSSRGPRASSAANPSSSTCSLSLNRWKRLIANTLLPRG